MARYKEDRSATDMFTSGSLEELVPGTSFARVVWSSLQGLDFSRFDASYANDVTGSSAIDPRRLTGVWILALVRGVTSSVKLAHACGHDVELRWMLGGAPVEKSTLSAFRKENVEALSDLGTQVLGALGRGGLLPGESVAVDGTIIRAASSCRSVYSRKNLLREVERLKEKIVEKLSGPEPAAEAVDVLLERQARFEKALGEMNALGLFEEKDRVTRSEPQAGLKKLKSGGFGPGYNVQIVTDARTGAILHAEIVDGANDQGQLGPQLTKAQAALEAAKGPAHLASTVVADSGYYDTRDLAALEARNVRTFVPEDRVKNRRPRGVAEAYRNEAFAHDAATDTLRCPQGQALSYRKMNNDKTSNVYQAATAACAACPAKKDCCPTTRQGRSVNRTAYPEVLAAVSARTASEEGVALKTRRRIVAEGVFARIKELLHWARCRCWGKTGATAELTWRSLAHNLMLLTKSWEPMAPAIAN